MNDQTATPSPKSAEILKAAHTLFMEQGYGATSMDAVAARAGVSKRTIYAHFESKNALFSEMMRAACERIGGADFADGGGDLEPTPRVFLERYGKGFVSIINSPEGVSVHRLVVHEAERFPELAAAFFETGPQRMIDALEERLADFSASGALSVEDPKYAAWLFLSMLKGQEHLERVLAMRDMAGPEETAVYVGRVVDDYLRIFAPAD